jgi:hypothetical protein
LLLAGLLFQVKVLESYVLVVHEFAFPPLAEAVLIILALVASEVVLDNAYLLEGELIETELKVNQILVDTCGLQPFGTASLIHLAVSQIKTDKSLVSLHALDKEEQLWYCRLLCVRFEWCIFILENIIAL